MSKINDNSIQELRNLEDKLIYKSMEKYYAFSKYVSKDFFISTFNSFLNDYSFESGLNPEIYYGLYIQCEVNKELLKQVRNGDIDLEIELIDYYMPLLNQIINKKNLISVITDKEAILILAFETYSGDKLFSLHLSDTLRRYVNGDVLKPIVDSDTDNGNNVVENFEQLVKKYGSNYQCPQQLSYIDNLVVKFDLINTEDEKLKKYIYLRFGYYNGIIFSNEDISKILDVSLDDSINIYKDVLLALKNKINDILSLIILCQAESIFKDNNYIKVL